MTQTSALKSTCWTSLVVGGWEPTCHRRGWSRRSPHATGQLSPRAATTEAWGPWAYAQQQEKAPQWEARMSQLESSPRSLQLQKARTQQRRPGVAEKNFFFKLLKKKKNNPDNRSWNLLSETRSAFLHYFNETDEHMSWRMVSTVLWKFCFSYSHKHIRPMSWSKMGFLL